MNGKEEWERGEGLGVERKGRKRGGSREGEVRGFDKVLLMGLAMVVADEDHTDALIFKAVMTIATELSFYYTEAGNSESNSEAVVAGRNKRNAKRRVKRGRRVQKHEFLTPFLRPPRRSHK